MEKHKGNKPCLLEALQLSKLLQHPDQTHHYPQRKFDGYTLNIAWKYAGV
jgi:hypothetical protein